MTVDLRRVLSVTIPLALVAIVVALRPEILTGTFSSVTSVAKVLALVAAWIGFSWLMRRLISQPVARTAVIAAVGIGLLSVTVLPYFREEKVDDPFPAAASDTTPPTEPAAVDLPAAAPATTVVSAPTTTPTVAPAGPQKLASGQLRGLAGHRGAGEAAIYRQPDGSHVVRLEDFNVSSVPAPVLYLVPGAGRESPGGVKLGGLRGSTGNQNFTVPAGTNVSGTQTVLIWCEAFSVPVAGATAAA